MKRRRREKEGHWLVGVDLPGDEADDGQLDHCAEHKGNAAQHPHIHCLHIGHPGQILVDVAELEGKRRWEEEGEDGRRGGMKRMKRGEEERRMDGLKRGGGER